VGRGRRGESRLTCKGTQSVLATSFCRQDRPKFDFQLAVVLHRQQLAGNAGLANLQIFRFFTDSSRSRAKVSYEW
jgi:hypothetical protein